MSEENNKENTALFDRIFTLELQVGFLLPKIIKAMDALGKNNAASNYLIGEMEHLIKEIPKTDARNDERFLKAAENALSTVKRSLDAPQDQEWFLSFRLMQAPHLLLGCFFSIQRYSTPVVQYVIQYHLFLATS